MLFVDPFFLFVVLPTALAVFYLSGRYAGRIAALTVIVVASALFYAPYGAFDAALLFVSLVVNLAVGAALAQSRDDVDGRRRMLFLLGIGANLLALATFKYWDQVVRLFAPTGGPLLGVAIPAGISFYTFHQSVFLLDAYRREHDVAALLKDARGWAGRFFVFIRYAAFVALFPQLVIGPITYFNEFAPQAESPGFGRPRLSNLQVGATLMIVGLFKKLLIADAIAVQIDPLFGALAHGASLDMPHAWFAMIGYFFQLYFDFSGYSDVSLGIARLFGLRLPMNFDSPLRATGIVDFYRRWHMTLTRVIALFVFTPLSVWGTRFSIERKYRGWRRRALGAWVPFLVNFQLIALWHSAKTTFVVFGLIHGVWYILENEIRGGKAFKAFRARTSDRFRMIAGMALTALPLMITFALFRSDDLGSFLALMSAAAGMGPKVSSVVGADGAVAAAIKTPVWVRLCLVAVVVYAMPNIYEILRRYRPCLPTFANKPTTAALLAVAWRPNLIWTLALAVLAGFVFANLNRPTPFLYAGF